MKYRTGRKIAVLGLMVLMTAVLGGCGKKSKGGVDGIRKAGVLKTVVYKESDPQTSRGKREQTLVAEIASQLGVTNEYVEAANLEEAEEMLSNGTANIAIGGIADTIPVPKGLVSSQVYLKEDLYVVTLRGDYSDCPAAFEGRILGFSETIPESAVMWTADYPGIKPVYIEMASVEAGLFQAKINGYVCGADEARVLSESSANLQVQNLTGVDSTGYVILMKNGDNLLPAGINKIIGMDLEETEEAEASEESMTQEGK